MRRGGAADELQTSATTRRRALGAVLLGADELAVQPDGQHVFARARLRALCATREIRTVAARPGDDVVALWITLRGDAEHLVAVAGAAGQPQIRFSGELEGFDGARIVGVEGDAHRTPTISRFRT